MDQGTKAFMTPCFESQNTYLEALGLQPVIGGWILELEVVDDSIVRTTPSDIFFKNAIEKDW